MQVFRIAISLIKSHRITFIIYVLVFSFMAFLMGMSIGGSATGEYETVRPAVAVIDRDGSEVSRALVGYLDDLGEPVEIEDSTYALQDAAARDLASYVLVIPAGYGEDLLAAARAARPAPALGCQVSYMGAQGALIDERVRAWAQLVYAFAAVSDAPASELLSWVDAAQTERAQVEVARIEQKSLPLSYLGYAQFATYPLFGGVAVIVVAGLASLRDADVCARVMASGIARSSFARQIGLAIVAASAVVWLVNALLGLVLFGGDLTGVAPAYVALALMVLFALALVGASFGFLIWQLGASTEVAHAAANIFAMVVTFLGGAWVSIDQMGAAVRTAAQFTPAYWVIRALGAIYSATDLTPELVRTVFTNAGVTVLFALAITGVALVVNRPART